MLAVKLERRSGGVEHRASWRDVHRRRARRESCHPQEVGVPQHFLENHRVSQRQLEVWWTEIGIFVDRQKDAAGLDLGKLTLVNRPFVGLHPHLVRWGTRPFEQLL